MGAARGFRLGRARSACSSSSWWASNCLPPPLLQSCTEAEVLRASFPAFSLPTNGRHLALLLHLSALDCSRSPGGALLGMRAASLSVACSAEGRAAELVLAAADGSASTRLALPPDSTAGSSGLALLLSLDQQAGSFDICADGQLLLPAAGSSGTGGSVLLQRLGSLSPAELVGPAVVLGARSDDELAAHVQVAAAYAADFAIPCGSTAPGEEQAGLLELLADSAAAGGMASSMPQLAVEQQPSGDATVGRDIVLTATAMPASADDALRRGGRGRCSKLASEACRERLCLQGPAGFPAYLPADWGLECVVLHHTKQCHIHDTSWAALQAAPHALWPGPAGVHRL